MIAKPSETQHTPTTELYLATAVCLVVLSGWPAWELVSRVTLVICLAAVVVFKSQLLEQSRLWFALTLAFALWIAGNPLGVGNHQFVGVYLCLATGLVLVHRDSEWRSQWAFNARWLLVGVMAFATIQKLFSPEYIRGDFWGYFLSFGLAGKFVFGTGLWDSTVSLFQENRETLTTLATNGFGDESSAPIKPPFTYFKVVVMAITWATLAAEAVIAITYALFPRSAFTHTFLLVFVGVLLLIRPEVEFASFALILGRVSAGELPRSLKIAYNLGIAICLALSLALHHVDLGVIA